MNVSAGFAFAEGVSDQDATGSMTLLLGGG